MIITSPRKKSIDSILFVCVIVSMSIESLIDVNKVYLQGNAEL
jgi:hypothetical protein